MSKQVSVKTLKGSKYYYKISESGGYFECYKSSDGSYMGKAKTLDDALSIIKSYVSSKHGSIDRINIG
jgi:hypothetical protein